MAGTIPKNVWVLLSPERQKKMKEDGWVVVDNDEFNKPKGEASTEPAKGELKPDAPPAESKPNTEGGKAGIPIDKQIQKLIGDREISELSDNEKKEYEALKEKFKAATGRDYEPGEPPAIEPEPKKEPVEPGPRLNKKEETRKIVNDWLDEDER